MKTLLIIGIGAGDPDYLTVQAINALNRTDVFFLMDKGSAKDSLIGLRKTICERFIQGRDYRFASAECPERVRDVPDDVHGALTSRAAQEWLDRTRQAEPIPSKLSAAQVIRDLRDPR